MIKGYSSYQLVHGLNEEEDLEPMRLYLLGAVQAWCRDRKGEWFAARDLLGGPNFYWQGTPLYKLFKYYRQFGEDDYAITQAGRAAGRLLKHVLVEDKKRTYETRQGYTREYRWVDDENLDIE